MRVLIVDTDPPEGRRLAAQIEDLLPTADVILYKQADGAIAGVGEHRPDVVIAAHAPPGLDAPDFLSRVRELQDADPKLVGLLDAPDPELSVRLVDSGVTVVIARPVDRTDLRMVLRHRAAGVP
jgi:DNA-binding response OmpR family regulator